MPLNSKLDDAEIRHVVREAEIGVATGEDPKVALVKSLTDHVVSKLAAETATQVNAALDMHIMLSGDYDGTNEWIAGMQAIVTPVCNKLEIHTTLSYGDTPGVMAEPDGALRDHAGRYQQLLALFYPAAQQVLSKLQPMPMNRGKFLARYGIVKQHIDAITNGVAKTVVAAANAGLAGMVAAPPPPAFDMAAMLGTSEPGLGAVALPPPAAPPLNPGDGSVPTPAALRDALMLFRQGTDVDDAGYAKRLGMSRSTFHNYISGKTEKPKLTIEQARILVADIDVRVAALRKAAELFERIR